MTGEERFQRLGKGFEMKTPSNVLVPAVFVLLAANAFGAVPDAETEDGIRILIEAAEHDDYEAQTYAVRALRRVGPPAVEPLVGLLHDENDKVRELVAQALGNLKGDAVGAIPELFAMLADKNPEVRGHAALALGHIAQEPDVCIPALLLALVDDVEWPRRAAAEALWRFEAQASEIIRHLTDGVASEDPNVRRGSAECLGWFVAKFDEVLPVLIRALNDPNQGVRCAAVSSLQRTGLKAQPSIPTFLRMLKEDEPEVRCAAARSLYVVKMPIGGKASPDEPLVIAALLEAMIEDEEVCATAAYTLGNMGLPGHEALVKALGSENLCARLNASRICAERSDLSELAKPLLVESLETENQELRWYAALGLAHTKEVPDVAMAVLRDILEHKDESHTQLRDRVVGVSRRIGHAGIPCLAVAAKDPVSSIRRGAIYCLGNMPDGDDEIVPVLIAALRDQDWTVRIAAIEALGEKADRAQRVLPDLEAMLKDTKSRVRLSAADVLTRVDSEAAAKAGAETLLGLLGEQDAYVQQTAASELVQLGRDIDAVMPVLLNGLRSRQRAGDTPSDILAAQTLAVIGPKTAENEEVLALLAKMLEDRDRTARATAMNTLATIAPDREWLITSLVNALGNGDEEERLSVFRALKKMGPLAKAAIPALEELCRSDIRLRSSADEVLDAILAEDVKRFRSDIDPRVVSMLLGIGTDDMDADRQAGATLTSLGQQAVPDLIRVLSDKKYRLRSKAAYALAIIGPDVSGTDEAIPHLIELTDDYSPRARYSAVRALAAIDAPANVTLPVFLKALHDDDHQVVGEAAKALTEMGPEAKPALPALVEAMKQEGRASLAASVISDIGPDASLVPALLQIVKKGQSDTRDGSRASAMHVLRLLGPAAEDATADLVPILRNEGDQDLRVQAAQVLGAIGVEAAEAVPDLKKIALDDRRDWGIRLACAGALKRVDPESVEAVSIIREAMDEESLEVRHGAVTALAAINPTADEEVVRLLGKALSDPDADIRYKAILTLTLNGANTRPIIPAIRRVASDPKEQGCGYAREILKRLGETVE